MATVEKAARLRQSKTYLPDHEREELLQFAQVLNGINLAVDQPGQAMLVGPDGKQVPIPAELFQVLEEAANVLALGDGISILPYSAKLTTQEAADFLGMSRPTFVKLLTSGEIPFEMAGRHRRVHCVTWWTTKTAPSVSGARHWLSSPRTRSSTTTNCRRACHH